MKVLVKQDSGSLKGWMKTNCEDLFCRDGDCPQKQCADWKAEDEENRTITMVDAGSFDKDDYFSLSQVKTEKIAEAKKMMTDFLYREYPREDINDAYYRVADNVNGLISLLKSSSDFSSLKTAVSDSGFDIPAELTELDARRLDLTGQWQTHQKTINGLSSVAEVKAYVISYA